MTTISKQNTLVTLINVFTVQPKQQQLLLDLLARATEIVGRAPGFISASLHRGDSTQHASVVELRDGTLLRDQRGVTPGRIRRTRTTSDR